MFTSMRRAHNKPRPDLVQIDQSKTNKFSQKTGAIKRRWVHRKCLLHFESGRKRDEEDCPQDCMTLLSNWKYNLRVCIYLTEFPPREPTSYGLRGGCYPPTRFEEEGRRAIPLLALRALDARHASKRVSQHQGRPVHRTRRPGLQARWKRGAKLHISLLLSHQRSEASEPQHVHKDTLPSSFSRG